ncbi:hypothetical protein J6590_028388 [Homalodisca vitripennis]|nr:hypothetical protein J6590_028388 [Homalodisca vitripennis]
MLCLTTTYERDRNSLDPQTGCRWAESLITRCQVTTDNLICRALETCGTLVLTMAAAPDHSVIGRIGNVLNKMAAKQSPLVTPSWKNSSKVTSEPPPTAGQEDYLQKQDRSAVTHPGSSHARRCLIRLSRDNRRTHYTADCLVGYLFLKGPLPLLPGRENIYDEKGEGRAFIMSRPVLHPGLWRDVGNNFNHVTLEKGKVTLFQPLQSKRVGRQYPLEFRLAKTFSTRRAPPTSTLHMTYRPNLFFYHGLSLYHVAGLKFQKQHITIVTLITFSLK